MPAIARFFVPLTLLAAVTAFDAQAAERQARPVSGFNGVSLAAPMKMELVQGDTESLVLEGDTEALASIETVVENGTLMIRSRSRWSFGKTPKIRAFVTAKNIESLRISGSGDVTLWAKESLTVKIAGAGDVRYFGDPALTKSVAGAGSVRRVGLAPS